MNFPDRRLRRLRRTEPWRRLVAETRLSVADLVVPVFVAEGADEPRAIESMPGVMVHCLESLAAEATDLVRLGVPGILIFGVPARRDAQGSSAWDPKGIVPASVRAVRSAVGAGLVVMCDLCLDEYTSHGHCGVLRHRSGSTTARESTAGGVQPSVETRAGITRPGGFPGADSALGGPEVGGPEVGGPEVGGPEVGDPEVDNDATVALYTRVALAQAASGADVVAPSGMMDGQVGAIRAALDGAGHTDVAIMAYAAKYASAAYGPFRDAVDVSFAGHRRAYQQDPANRREALAEVDRDVAEGADIVMVKPAMTSLDVIAAVRDRVTVPVAAYHVSGEYSMLKAAGERGWIDAAAMGAEQILAIKRAGADIIVTYLARELAEALA
ncbi:MAG: porphobilinogen synthase [Acidimicrobiales bacterium]